MKNLYVFLLAFTLMTTQSLTVATATFNQKRSISLSGVIDQTVLTKANELVSLVEESKEPINILIASPGGEISYGLLFIQAMKDAQLKGVKIRCFVPELAASMAFTIFTQCSERYALPYARLLFHSPRISGSFTITTQQAMQLAKGLSELEKTLLDMITPAMGVTEENGAAWFQEAYDSERLFLAQDLYQESPTRWFSVVGSVTGCPELYPNVWARADLVRVKARYEYTYTKRK